ncbi:uncharacterized protein F4822DRAFT_252738 [Hypoxylon trugodes]|uniref:uncharacterized protein n=1 Tax=Hypoxylon trugodes TaxID=326681 RepID=UPI00219843C6|nr:uncharacterized protein F4822DRAFT_252738 [Hypoxylon trugodes]KAI1388656.1 hypothetical protein F4822DRAFT_252738 [Hypoxylon trugodes]
MFSRELRAAEYQPDRYSPEIKPPRRKLRHRKIVSPQVGSLFDILHDYAATSLYVPPLCWTELHMQALGCRFVQQPPLTTPSPCESSSPPRSPPNQMPFEVVSLADDLSTLTNTTFALGKRSQAIVNFIQTMFPGRFWDHWGELGMRCGRHSCANGVRCQVLWYTHPDSLSSFSSIATCDPDASKSIEVSSPQPSPVMAYLDLTHINYVRKNCFRVPPFPDGSINIPIHRLQQIRSRKLIPVDPNEDQYIFATMIAMAQQSVYDSVPKGSGFKPRDIPVRIITLSQSGQSFIIYASVIPAALLSMFHEPHKAPRGDAGVTITYREINFWPILGLKERLGQALGKDLVGEFDEKSMDDYEGKLSPKSPKDDEQSQEELLGSVSQASSSAGERTPPTIHRKLSPKRKREILSEVFNASFSEDRETSAYPSKLLKRRCVAEGRIGVVR